MKPSLDEDSVKEEIDPTIVAEIPRLVSTQSKSQQTDVSEPVMAVDKFMREELDGVMVDLNKQKKENEDLKLKVAEYRSKIEAAFEANISESIADTKPVLECEQDVILKKLKEKYIAEQLLTIPEILAILPTRDDHGGKGGLLIR